MSSSSGKSAGISNKASAAQAARPAATGPALRSPTGSNSALHPAGGSLDDAALESTTLPPLYEAAVLYAADHYEATQDVLKAYLREPAGKNNLRAWLMLFDFFLLTHNRAEFDSLSMMFTVKFERSPPVWSDSESDGDPRRKEKRERKDYFQVKPAPDGALLSEIDRFEAFAGSMGSARIDFSKIKSILSEESELFSIVLQRIRRGKIPIWFNNLNEFTALLKKSINEKRGESGQGYWSLLFELFILDGRLAEYEALGLEYAVAFEMSPPAWEAVSRPSGGDGASEVGTSTGAFAAPSGGFQLKGVVGAGSKETLAQLAAYAAPRQEVLVDMGGVLRIDFSAVGMFFESIRAIHLAQKRVILSNLNELVAGLLEVFAVNKHAILMRKKNS